MRGRDRRSSWDEIGNPRPGNDLVTYLAKNYFTRKYNPPATGGVTTCHLAVYQVKVRFPRVQIGPSMALRKRQQRGIHLVKPKSNDPETLLQEAMAETYKTGETVPHSGIYRVSHDEHRLPHEVTLLRANTFPPCSKCGNNVSYKLLRAVTVDRFSVVLNAIPPLPDETQPMFAVEDEEQAG